MNTEPTSEQLEQLHDEAAAEAARVAAGVEGGDPIIDELADQGAVDGIGPAFEVVLNGQRLTDAEIADLLSRPDDLTEDERAALQPIFDAAAQQADEPQQVGVDPLDAAAGLLIEALTVLRAPAAAGSHHSPGWRLAEKIALGHAMAVLAQAEATRRLAMATQGQLQLIQAAQQQQLAKIAGPAGIVIPNGQIRL